MKDIKAQIEAVSNDIASRVEALVLDSPINRAEFIKNLITDELKPNTCACVYCGVTTPIMESAAIAEHVVSCPANPFRHENLLLKTLLEMLGNGLDEIVSKLKPEDPASKAMEALEALSAKVFNPAEPKLTPENYAHALRGRVVEMGNLDALEGAPGILIETTKEALACMPIEILYHQVHVLRCVPEAVGKQPLKTETDETPSPEKTESATL